MKAAEKVVAYYYDDEIGNYDYGGGNPMRPHRARMCYTLVDSYGLTKKMMLQRPRPRTFEELTAFHADDYINFLKGVTPNTVDENMTQLRRFNMGLAGEADCPVFDGMYEFCQTYSGGSVDGAAQLASGAAQLAFNWSGGMHHAKKAEASGFCYVNDIVLAILELLKTYARVLYVDIDIHHGDGVEEAFYLTDRVMTVSFHKFGEFFPGTGALDDIGHGKGKYYAVNVPLKDGMDDDSYRLMYEPIMQKVMEMYQPGAIVMCCGADSLSGDRLGCFNLSLEGHSNCLEFLAKFNVPMLIVGGGGYTLRNVARCWCYETGRMMGVDLPDGLPEKALDSFNMYMDTQRLRIAVSNMKNANDRQELEEIKTAVLEHLSRLPPVPSAQMAYVPQRMGRDRPEEGLPEEDPEARGGGQAHEDIRRVRDGDESDGEEGSGRGGYGEDPAALQGGRVYRRYAPEGGSGGGSRGQEQEEAKPLDLTAGQEAGGGRAAAAGGSGGGSGAAGGPAAPRPVQVDVAAALQQQQQLAGMALGLGVDPATAAARLAAAVQQQQQLAQQQQQQGAGAPHVAVKTEVKLEGSSGGGSSSGGGASAYPVGITGGGFTAGFMEANGGSAGGGSGAPAAGGEGHGMGVGVGGVPPELQQALANRQVLLGAYAGFPLGAAQQGGQLPGGGSGGGAGNMGQQ
ncbi:hypothetical protein Agub_g8235 [Astrephomene gubernaculifera]|uniref:histone deacetylase n=1 Tax=Astrephomene gubernaculifera TaxID=47775 RepID=A0AAD3DRC0_9CHLO|nr:hypothetical protein Agub_g8235 [Astrephomene gubernaculifera]